MSLRITLVALLAAALNQASSAFADRVGVEGPERRVLADHQFQSIQRMTDPFVTTHIRTGTGAGVATGFESPFIDTNGDTLGTLTGDLAFFSLSFEYQQNVMGWGALRLEVAGLGRAGIDEQSVLADGITTIYGGLLQGKAAVLRRENSLVSVVATFSRKNVFGLDPFGFAQSVVDSGGLTEDNSLVDDANIHRFWGGVAAAHAFTDWLGAAGFIQAGSAKPVMDDIDSETLFQAGLAGDFDLLPLKGYPLGLALGYDYDSFPEGGGDVAKGIHAGTFAVNYTGRRDLHLGLETTVSTLKQTDIESTLAATNFVFNLKYFF